MTVRKSHVASAVVFLVAFIVGATGIPVKTLAAGLPTPGPTKLALIAQQPTPNPNASLLQQSGPDQAIQAAFQAALQGNRNGILGMLIYDPVIDHIQYAADGETALIWMGLRDRQTGEVIATEPGLSIASNPNHAPSDKSSSWSIMLPNGADFTSQLRALPADLITQDIRSRFLDTPPASARDTAGAQVLTGYKLPWAAGLSKYVTNSIGHVYSVSGGLASCPTTCRYAFDFADGTMFPLLAAKGGTVKSFKTTCPNYGTDCTNFLILEDQSTVPTSYQIYYHMAYNTVPTRLRTIGAQVLQGEYIGDADDTGYSTGSHLHFHVYTSPTASDWSWGNSVDISFDDVTDNGGRPRTCAEAKEYPNLGSLCGSAGKYTSGNTPAHPPSATLDLPGDHQVVTDRTVRIQGTASDDIQVARIQVLVNYDGTWKAIDDIPPQGNGPYFKDVNLCSAGVPEGPFALKVQVYDREGSQAPNMPIRQMIKNANCSSAETPPAPACTPNDNQVALYADTDFRGACQKFDVNSAGYAASQFGALGDNNAASVQVGSSVRAILFDRSSDMTAARPQGRIETFEASDAGLADNRIGIDHVSGLKVVNRSEYPDEPFFNAVGNRVTEASPSSIDSLVLSWEGGAGATAYDVNLTGPGTNIAVTDSYANSLSVGSLAAGSYTLKVAAKNSVALNYSSKTFTVTSGSLPTVTAQTVPYQDSMENGPGNWYATGLWRYGSIDVGTRGTTKAWIFNNGTNYSDTTWRAGDLTSPPITLPSGGASYLRFAYYLEAEDGTPYWDQRRVQISANGGPFTDLYQFSDDRQPSPIWFNSGPISLAGFAGKTVRLRFHFDSVDEDNNTGKGWIVDDVSVTNQGPDTTCADNNNTPATAQPVNYGTSLDAVICPEGDIDYYKISGKAGQPVVVDIDARTLTPASKLDSDIFLLDSDKQSPLAESDDEQYGVLVDSLLSYTLQRDGDYYVKVKAWNYPGAAGKDFVYKMTLRANTLQPPQDVQILSPSANNRVPIVPFAITASAVDVDGGPSAQVDFYWHGPDWSKPWVLLGSDTTPADGWSYTVDPKQYGDIEGSALYVQARSQTGGVKGAVLWDLQPDGSTPVTKMNDLPATTPSTLIHLSWSSVDPANDLDHFDLQYQQNSGSGWSAWTGWTARSLAASDRSTWFTGKPGVSYRFRMRGVDQAGNTELFPDTPQASTTLESACKPDAQEAQGSSLSTAIPLQSQAISSKFNLCSASQAGLRDSDWFSFNASAGSPLLLFVLPRGGGAAFTVTLYQDATHKLGSWQSPDFANSIALQWTAPASGKYYLEVKPLTADMAGTDMNYQLWYGPGSWFYLPQTNQ